MISHILAFISVFFLTLSAFAQEKSQSSSTAPVIRFFEARRIGEADELFVIRITGRVSEPGYWQVTPEQEINVLLGEDYQSLKPAQAFPEKRVATRADGRFYFDMRLPNGNIQVPFTFVSSSNSPFNIVLTLKIEEKNIQFANKTEDYLEKPNQLNFGLGFNSLRLTQGINVGNGSSAGIDSTFWPELSVGFERKWTPHWRSTLELRSSPGEAKTSSTLTVDTESYTWNAYSIDNIFYIDPNFPIELLAGWKGRVQYRLGLQMQQLPYFRRIGAETVVIENANNSFATFGFGFQAKSALRLWVFDSFVRYQHLVAESDVLNLERLLAIESAVGLFRYLSDHWTFGAYFNGRFLQGDYAGVPDIQNVNGIQGNFEIDHYLFEARLSYLW